MFSHDERLVLVYSSVNISVDLRSFIFFKKFSAVRNTSPSSFSACARSPSRPAHAPRPSMFWSILKGLSNQRIWTSRGFEAQLRNSLTRREDFHVRTVTDVLWWVKDSRAKTKQQLWSSGDELLGARGCLWAWDRCRFCSTELLRRSVVVKWELSCKVNLHSAPPALSPEWTKLNYGCKRSKWINQGETRSTAPSHPEELRICKFTWIYMYIM